VMKSEQGAHDSEFFVAFSYRFGWSRLGFRQGIVSNTTALIFSTAFQSKLARSFFFYTESLA
jgi:hypothetical protein